MSRPSLKLDNEAIVVSYLAGNSPSVIASRLGVNRHTVTQRLQVEGVFKSNINKEINLNFNTHKKFIETVDGLLLGDGHITPKGQLQIHQEITHSEWIYNLQSKFWDIGVVSSVRFYPSRFGSIRGKSFRTSAGLRLCTSTYKELREQNKRWYLRDKKVIPSDLQLTPLTMALWFFGDGSYSRLGQLSFSTCAFSEADLNFLLCRFRKDLGLTPTMCKTGKGYRILLLSKLADAVRLKEILDPFMLGCFRYKFAFVRSPKPTGVRKLNEHQIYKIKNLIRRGITNHGIARIFGVSPSAISLIKRGKTYKDCIFGANDLT